MINSVGWVENSGGLGFSGLIWRLYSSQPRPSEVRRALLQRQVLGRGTEGHLRRQR